jgi:hypothetical protein
MVIEPSFATEMQLEIAIAEVIHGMSNWDGFRNIVLRGFGLDLAVFAAKTGIPPRVCFFLRSRPLPSIMVDAGSATVQAKAIRYVCFLMKKLDHLVSRRNFECSIKRCAGSSETAPSPSAHRGSCFLHRRRFRTAQWAA